MSCLQAKCYSIWQDSWRSSPLLIIIRILGQLVAVLGVSGVNRFMCFMCCQQGKQSRVFSHEKYVIPPTSKYVNVMGTL